MEQLQLMVTEETATRLRTVSELTEMPMGSLLDHLVLNLTPQSPEAATVLIMEKILVSISKLDEKDAAKVCGNIMGMLCQNIPPKEFSSIISDVENMQIPEGQKMNVMSKAEMDEFRKAFQDCIISQGK